MSWWKKLIALAISIPARMKGVQFGKNSFFGPSYNWDPPMRGIILGDNVSIGRSAWLEISNQTKGGKIIIDDGTSIGRNVTISACKKVVIGKKCLFSYNVSIVDHDHAVLDKNISPMESGITEGVEIEIGDECFIGAHSFILKGVKLGKHCVVGANSVVTKSFSDYSVVAGSPARLLKNL